MVSGAQASAIQGHWNSKVKANMQAVGNALFVKYFTANPGDQAFFKAFAGVGVGDLPGNSAFNAQTMAVMQYMDKIVAGMGSNHVQLMQAKKADHAARGVDGSYFKKMFDFLPGFIGENGGDGACVDAWKAAGAELSAAMK